jgi:hypothetical protein
MKYVFLVGNEHHLQQVDFAIKHFGISEENLILLVQEINNTDKLIFRINVNKSYRYVFSFLNWTFSDIIKFNNFYFNFIELCKDIKNINEEIVFFASHYSDDSTFLFLSIVNPKKFYLMDEGTAAYKALSQRSVFFSTLKLKLFLKSFLYGIRLSVPRSLSYFTRFNFIPGPKDQKELYIPLKIKNNIQLDFTKFAFLGSSVVELNMMDEEVYLYYLNEIRVKNYNIELLYFKHRKEEESKLFKIKNMGFQIIDINMPFENYFSLQLKIPFILSSFFTTSVLINISENFKNTPKLDIYVFPLKYLKKDKLVYENILNYLKIDNQLNIILLDKKSEKK